MWLETLSGLSSGLIVYHHLAYPLLLKQLASRRRSRRAARGVCDGKKGSPVADTDRARL